MSVWTHITGSVMLDTIPILDNDITRFQRIFGRWENPWFKDFEYSPHALDNKECYGLGDPNPFRIRRSVILSHFYA